MQGLESHPVAATLLQGFFGRSEQHFDVDVFGHPINESVRLGQARTASEDQPNTSVVTTVFPFTRVEVAEVVVVNLKLAQPSEQLGDVDIFFGGLYRKASKQTFGCEVFKRLLLRGRNRSHTPPCGLPPRSFC